MRSWNGKHNVGSLQMCTIVVPLTKPTIRKDFCLKFTLAYRKKLDNSHLFGSIHHHNGFEMKQDVLYVQTFSFNLRVFTSKSGERCRNYNSFYMCLPLFKGPKVMGQTNNHKSNFHFLILGCKSFAVNYSLKSGTHRHHQTLGFIPGDALPGLYCNCLQFLLVLGAFSLQSSASEMHAQSDSGQVIDLAIA